MPFHHPVRVYIFVYMSQGEGKPSVGLDDQPAFTPGKKISKTAHTC